MFTGIIKAVGTVDAVEHRGGDVRLSVSVEGLPGRRRKPGDSIAVNGVCLTVLDEAMPIRFDVSVETLSRTLIGDFEVGRRVNLEPALTPADPLGGHLVSGHVDGVAKIEATRASARSTVFEFSAPARLGRFIAAKGSLALDGISLTVNTVEDAGELVRFSVNIVPHTIAHTNLGWLQAGDPMHLEIDQVARYLERLAAATMST